MDEDGLLRELARAAREEAAERERWDERWDRLAAGELSAKEEAELRDLAARSPEAAQAYEAFRPLGPEFQARVLGAIRTQSAAESPLPKGDELESKPAAAPEWSHLFRLPKLRLAFAGMGAAAAAALLLVLRIPAPLPGYVIAVAPGIQEFRGEDPAQKGIVILAPGARFVATAQPATRLTGRTAPEAIFFLAADGPGGRKVRQLAARVVTADPSGSLQLDGTIDRGQPPGPATLWTVVGYPGRLPTPSEIADLPAGEVHRRNWYAKPTPIEIRAP
jgi:hypothetical protein